MKVKDNSFTIVLLGKWNKYILTPEWISHKLLDKEEVQVQFSLNLDAPLRIVKDNIILSSSSDKIIFISQDNSEETLQLMVDLAIKLYKLLPDTPVSGVGVNFGFTENENIEKLSKTIDLPDNLADEHSELTNTVVKRTLKRDNYLINFSIIYTVENAVFDLDFNFHHNIPTAEHDIQPFLVDNVSKYKEISENLLKENYGLELE